MKYVNLNAIISSDNHILDGHHRWAATMFSKPEAQVQGKLSNLPIDELITVLRGAGVAYGNPFRGKESESDINIYKADASNIAQQIDILNQGNKFIQPGAAQQFVDTLGGLEVLGQRLQNIQAKTPPPGAPPRQKMPVIDAGGPVSGKNEVEDVSQKLNKGYIDVHAPYAEG